MPKPTLEEMATLAQESADEARSRAAHYSGVYPDPVWHKHWVHRAEVWEALHRLLLILVTFEDRARKFIAGLLAEWQR